MNDLPEELGFNQNNISKAELSYIEQGFYDYKKCFFGYCLWNYQ